MGVVPPQHPQDERLTLRNNLVVRVPVARVNNLGKVHADPGVQEWCVLVGSQTVDQLTDLVHPELLCVIAKHEQHGVDHVELYGPVGTNHGRESLVEWTYGLEACIRLEVLEDLMYHIKRSMRNSFISCVAIAGWWNMSKLLLFNVQKTFVVRFYCLNEIHWSSQPGFYIKND